jgi:competence protein ComEC
MTVRFYDVGQALAVLVELPDGRRVLIDAGEQPKRAGCGAPCERWSQHLLESLERDLPDKRLDLLWITHQHSDHAGNAEAILRGFRVAQYVDNGTNLASGPIERARKAAEESETDVVVVDPARADCPLADGAEITFKPLVPSAWPRRCDDEPNDCSIGLRIDYCESSVLFTGDAEHGEEAAFELASPARLLQVGHHGSDTSSSEAFMNKVRPSWAVISVAKRNEGTNRTYCHPRRSTVERLSSLVGGSAPRPLEVFQGERCSDSDWTTIDVSERILVTARDGDITLTTTGNGEFALLH